MSLCGFSMISQALKTADKFLSKVPVLVHTNADEKAALVLPKDGLVLAVGAELQQAIIGAA